MMQWWSERQPRERALLVAVAALAAAFAVFQALVVPLLHYRAAAREQHDAALAMLRDVEDGARVVQGLRAAQGARAEGSARTVVSATATELGLAVTRLQPLESGDLDVWLDGVAAPLLYAWVGRLQDRGIPVARAVIQKSDGGTVNAQITFARTAAPGGSGA